MFSINNEKHYEYMSQVKCGSPREPIIRNMAEFGAKGAEKWHIFGSAGAERIFTLEIFSIFFLNSEKLEAFNELAFIFIPKFLINL